MFIIKKSFCQLARLEAVQRSSVEGVSGAVGDGRTPVIKLINVALSILALLLVVVGLVINMFGPFVSTRLAILQSSSPMQLENSDVWTGK